jgi:hypothetical protein
MIMPGRSWVAGIDIAGQISFISQTIAGKVAEGRIEPHFPRMWELNCYLTRAWASWKPRFCLKTIGKIEPRIIAWNRYLLLPAPWGAGKTTVMAEASDILALHKIAHAAIDLDALGLAYLPDAKPTNTVMYTNLKSLCENYFSLGIKRLLLARAVQDRTELELCRSAVSATNIVVCRLNASPGVMTRRVAMRESGMLRNAYIARSAELNPILDKAQLEDFPIANEDRPLQEVAREMLTKAGWIPD